MPMASVKARLKVDEATFNEQLIQLQKYLASAESEKDDAIKEWKAVWQPLGVVSRSPKEMEQWLQSFLSLVDELRDIRDRSTKTKVVGRDIETHRQKLIQGLQGFDKPTGDETLNALIKRGQTIVKNVEKHVQKRALLERDKASREKELTSERSKLENNRQEMKHWQQQWETAVRPIGLEVEAMPAQATAVMEELNRLFEKLKESGILQKRIAEIYI